MPAPLTIDSRREPSGSHLSSSASSVVTLRPGNASSSPSELRRTTSPMQAMPSTYGTSMKFQPSSFPASHPEKQFPSNALEQQDSMSSEEAYNEHEIKSGYVPSSAPVTGAKRHISFSKRFSLSGSAGWHSDARQGTAVNNTLDVGPTAKNYVPTENANSQHSDATSGSNWTTPTKRHVVEPILPLPESSRSLTRSPKPSPGHHRVSSIHDPYDYRKNSPHKEASTYDSQDNTNQTIPEDVPGLRRTLSRRKRQEQIGNNSGEDRTPFIFGSGESSRQREAQPAAPIESRSTASSSTPSKNSGQKDKKSMLSRALQRANDAVALDNAQNYAAAKEAYEEACDYLSRVMGRSSNEDDKKRLMGIRATYMARVEELQQLGSRISLRSDQSSDSASQVSSVHASFDGASDEQTVTHFGQTAVKVKLAGKEQEQLDTGISRDKPIYNNFDSMTVNGEPTVMRLRMRGQDKPSGPVQPVAELTPSNLYSASVLSGALQNESYELERPLMPEDLWKASRIGSPKLTQTGFNSSVVRRPSQASSNHSMTSVNGIRRKHLRIGSGQTEADFDAALDAAVEAVYDDGYEPYNTNDVRPGASYYSRMASNNRAFTEYDSFAEREAAILAIRNRSAAQLSLKSTESASELESETETDEDERILDGVTRKLMTDDHILDKQIKSVIPRQSDSSGSSGRTWASSGASSISTLATPLSPVNETRAAPATFVRQQTRHLPPPTPPPTTALPSLPPNANPSNSHQHQHPGLQDRRLSGQRIKRLQIKTVARPRIDPSSVSTSDLSTLSDQLRSSESPPSVTPNSVTRFDTSTSGEPFAPGPVSVEDENEGLADSPNQGPHVVLHSSTSSGFSPTTSSATTIAGPDTKSGLSPDSASAGNPLDRFHTQHPPFPKSLSSTSLLTKVQSYGSAELLDKSPETPVSFGFTTISPPGWRTTPTGTLAVNSPPPIPHVDKVQLFANEIHAPNSPNSPNPRVLHPPRPLEPCPESCLLRPFWLLRCVYQTIAHPRGGYITRKLFIPREVWKTKNLKLRASEEKVSACDMLTAALLKLGRVNTLDADAVLEEFQSLEAVMDQVQTILTKKLGNEVGVHHIAALFKDAPPTVPSTTSGETSESATHSFSTDPGTNASSTGSFGKASGKSSFNLSSWRKLRNRNSSTSLSASFTSVKDAPKESLVMASLPMASKNADEPVFRGNRRSMLARPVVGAADAMKFEGPNASYMAALARLCEAVQVLDQIARQVEDPGLKASSPTHVGLELSARHAAEFFGFYICRFVLQDITILADKFIKRASEWVML